MSIESAATVSEALPALDMPQLNPQPVPTGLRWRDATKEAVNRRALIEQVSSIWI